MLLLDHIPKWNVINLQLLNEQMGIGNYSVSYAQYKSANKLRVTER
jgi:hypothetical protein